MSQRDKLGRPKLRRHFISVKDMMGIIGAAGADVGTSAGAPVVAVAAGASEIGVLQMNAANDEVTHFMPIPWDLDRNKKVLGRIWFIHSSTDADTPVWHVKSKFLAKQATVVDTDTSEDKDTTFAAHTCSTTAESFEITTWTDLNWDLYVQSTDAAVQMLVACTSLGSASADEIELLGLELLYEVDATSERVERSALAIVENPL